MANRRCGTTTAAASRRSLSAWSRRHFWRTLIIVCASWEATSWKRSVRRLAIVTSILNLIFQLPPSDFLNLSLTCRYLHWRMFTLCTCHAPCTVQMEIASDRMVDGLREYHNLPKLLYRVQGEQRGLFVCQPPCLKKPFLFETLEMTLNVSSHLFIIVSLRLQKIDYKRDDFDRCLPFILAVQKYAKRLLVIMDTEIFRWPSSRL